MGDAGTAEAHGSQFRRRRLCRTEKRRNDAGCTVIPVKTGQLMPAAWNYANDKPESAQCAGLTGCCHNNGEMRGACLPRGEKTMNREMDMAEVSDGKLYGLDDMVKADCAGCEGCHACCTGMGTSVVLDPLTRTA